MNLQMVSELGRCAFCHEDATVVWPMDPSCPQLNGKRICDACAIAQLPLLVNVARRIPRPTKPRRTPATRTKSRRASSARQDCLQP